MSTFEDLNLSKQLHYALDDLGFTQPTPIQEQSFSKILSGKDMVGIAQTGTGKTFAFVLPILRDLKFSKQINPRVLILVPTRELVLQIVEEVHKLTAYMNVRTIGVYGGVNINAQKQTIAQGADIVVATPGRLYDLALSRALKLKSIQKLVIDEVDVMLDLGFRFQLKNIFELLPERRQNIMFSATMTEEVDTLIDDYFIAHLLQDKEVYHKVLVFTSHKKDADRLFEVIEEEYPTEGCVIHSNKTQNYRMRSIKQFDEGDNRILIATDVMSRGLDLAEISHVVNFDTPKFPENYMHRIGRTGRAKHEGASLLFVTEKENEAKERIEQLMNC